MTRSVRRPTIPKSAACDFSPARSRRGALRASRLRNRRFLNGAEHRPSAGRGGVVLAVAHPHANNRWGVRAGSVGRDRPGADAGAARRSGSPRHFVGRLLGGRGRVPGRAPRGRRWRVPADRGSGPERGGLSRQRRAGGWRLLLSRQGVQRRRGVGLYRRGLRHGHVPPRRPSRSLSTAPRTGRPRPWWRPCTPAVGSQCPSTPVVVYAYFGDHQPNLGGSVPYVSGLRTRVPDGLRGQDQLSRAGRRFALPQHSTSRTWRPSFWSRRAFRSGRCSTPTAGCGCCATDNSRSVPTRRSPQLPGVSLSRFARRPLN